MCHNVGQSLHCLCLGAKEHTKTSVYGRRLAHLGPSFGESFCIPYQEMRNINSLLVAEGIMKVGPGRIQKADLEQHLLSQSQPLLHAAGEGWMPLWSCDPEMAI